MNQKKIDLMREGGHLLAEIRETLKEMVKPGITLKEIDQKADDLLAKTGGQPSFKMVPGYHNATCINLNDGIVHGIPTPTPIKDGDIVSIDLGLYYKGFHTDTSTTVVAGNATKEQEKLLNTCRNALAAGINQARPGNSVTDISKAIEKVITSAGYTPIRDLTGHGVGKSLHEDPYIPNFYIEGMPEHILKPGMTLAIEPMLTPGSPKIKVLDDDWTVVTADGSPTALFEHTIAVTDTNPLILTQ